MDLRPTCHRTSVRHRTATVTRGRRSRGRPGAPRHGHRPTRCGAGCRHGYRSTSPLPREPHVRHRISARIGGIAESATLAVDAKAKALKAAGRPVIGFGAGEPDFPTPDRIVAAAQAACADPKNHRYTPAAGLPELREAVAEKTLRDSRLRGRPPTRC